MFQQQQSLTGSTSDDTLLCELTSKLENFLKIEKKPPNALICSICNNLLTDPVIMSCCASSFCQKCVSATINNMNSAVCPGDGCDKIVGHLALISNFKLRGIVECWLQQSGAEEWKSPTPNITRNKLAPVDNCPPPSLKCPICTKLMKECGTMYCCGTNFCNDCIANIVSSLREPVCPGAGCNNKNVGCGSYDTNFTLQHAAQEWFSRLESLKNARNAKMFEQITYDIDLSEASSLPSFESLEMARLMETSDPHGASDQQLSTAYDFSTLANTMVPVMSSIPTGIGNMVFNFNQSAITAQSIGTDHTDGTSDDPMLDIVNSVAPTSKPQHPRIIFDLSPAKTSKTNPLRRSAPTTSQKANIWSNARESVFSRLSYNGEVGSFATYHCNRRNRCEYERARDNGRQVNGRKKQKRKASGYDEELESYRKMRSVNNARQAREVIHEDIEIIIRADHHSDRIIVP